MYFGVRHRDIASDRVDFEISLILNSFGKLAVGLMLPVYLYNIFGFSFAEILLYFSAHHLLFCIFVIIMAKVVVAISPKRTMAIATIPLLISYYLMTQLDSNPSYIFILPVLTGFYSSIYWQSYHYLLSHTSNKKHRSTAIATKMIIMVLASSFAPIIGGFLTELYGLNTAFLFAGVTVTISLIPLLIMRTLAPTQKYSIREFFYFIRSSIAQRMLPSCIAEGFSGAVFLLMWPLMLFTLVGSSYSIFGLVSGIGALTVAIGMRVIARMTEKHHKHFIIRCGTCMGLFGVGAKIGAGIFAITNPYMLWAIATWRQLSMAFLRIPTETEFENIFALRRINPQYAIVWHEVAIHLSWVVAFWLIYLPYHLLHVDPFEHLYIGFWLAVIGILLLPNLARRGK